jgi:hypothetical protein
LRFATNAEHDFARRSYFRPHEMTSSARLFPFFVVSLFHMGSLRAQRAAVDTTFFVPAAQQAHDLHAHAMGANAGLYNGVHYKESPIRIADVGYPLAWDGKWEQGTIDYDGQHYSNVEMNHDLVRDKVVIVNPYTQLKIELINEKLASFSLHGHEFVRLAPVPGQLTGGFYDVLVSGPVQLFLKRTKTRQPHVAQGMSGVDFRETRQFYLFRNDTYFPVATRASVLKVLADRKVELRKFMSKNKIRFRKGREQALVQIVRFFNETPTP